MSPPIPISQAFPNAYLEVDEPPSRVLRVRIIALMGTIGLVYFGLTILALHFEPTGYDPVSQVVSDYAVGSFAAVMSFGFFVGGAGVTALGLALVLVGDRRRVFKGGALMLFIAGLALFSVGGFPTDIEGAESTVHGTIHGLLSMVVFTLGPIGMILVSYTQGRLWLSITLVAFVIAGAFLVANNVFALNANGFTERIFIATLLGWWVLVSFRVFKNPNEFGMRTP